jgi:transmembrane sensor
MDLEHYTAREEAAQWLARVDRGLRQHEGVTLRDWLKHPVNRSAIVDVARSWHGPEVIALLAELFPITAQAMARTTRRGSANILVAATAAVCVVLLGTWMLNDQRHWSRFAASWSASHDSQSASHLPLLKEAYATVVGQQREIVLPDRSTITLNTDTSVVVTYSLRERDVLLPHGEASFRVAQEPERPFVVRAGPHRRFQAVGTQFDVRLLTPDHMELIVTEGTVKVFETPIVWAETPALARLRDNMTYGETTVGAPAVVQVEPGLQFVRKVEAGAVDDLLAWQRGRIVFKGERLEDVLTEVDRYTNARFVLSGDELRNIRVVGGFRTGHIDDFLLLLRKNYFIISERDGEGRIVLRPLSHPDSRL